MWLFKKTLTHCIFIRMDELELKCTGCLYLNILIKFPWVITKGNEEFAVMPRLLHICISDSYVTYCNLWQLLSENPSQRLRKIQTLEPGNLKNICDLEFALYNVYKTSEKVTHGGIITKNTSSYTNTDMENNDYKLQR